MPITLAAVSIIITVLSSAYSIYQAKKQQKKQKALNEARKGFEIPVNGESIHLPVVYGRALIGGARVYHNTSSDFNFVAPNSDKEFITGLTAAQRINPIYKTRYSLGGRGPSIPVTINGLNNATVLTSSMKSKKNAFLYFQQALCAGPIHAVHDVIIDESHYIDDPLMGTDLYASSDNKIEGALRLDFHYAGSVADSIISANFSERNTATFDGIAYLSGVARLDRENPQFNGTPTIQALVEGKLVRRLVGGVLQPFAYSNASPWCLLDYLTDTVNGKGLPLSKIDLPSFEAGGLLAERIIQNGVAVYGKIWQPTDGSRDIKLRDLPLYECNLTLDTSRPIRENIEAILGTMGDARLVWSGGKYKLLMQYPAINDDIAFALELNDSNIFVEDDIEVNWPNASDRQNYCTVKFKNEAINFKDDSASWPPKLGTDIETQTTHVGMGGFNYGFGSSASGWDDAKIGGRLLNNLSVWSGNLPFTDLEYHFMIKPNPGGAPFTLEFTGDDDMTVEVRDVLTNTVIYTGSHSNWKTIVSTALSLGHPTEDRIYRINFTGVDTSGEEADDEGSKTKGRGIAARIIQGNFIIWTTREPAYTGFEEMTLNNTIYRTMLAEDNGLELEMETVGDGITDRYHALAKAEELVRTSRGAASIKMSYLVRDKILEPGDFVKINSKLLALGPLYARVAEAQMRADWTCELELSVFDATFLAWNVKDNEHIVPPAIYNFTIPAPIELAYEVSAEGIIGSSGRLVWSSPGFVDVDAYILYAHVQGDALDVNGNPVFKEIGRTNETFYQLPQINGQYAFFGVRTLAKSGKYSIITYLGTDIDPDGSYVVNGVDLSHTYSRFTKIQASEIAFVRTSSTGLTVPASITLTANHQGFATPHFDWYVDDVLVPSHDMPTYVLPQFTDVDHKRVRLVMYDDPALWQDSLEDKIDIQFQDVITQSSQQVTLYKRSVTVPTAPSTTLVYTFATGVLSGNLEGWSQNVPVGSDALYTTRALAISTGPTADILPAAWSPPGAFSFNPATVVLTPVSQTLPAYADGNVVSYDRAIGYLTVLQSGANVTPAAALSVVATDCVGTINTADNVPVNGQPKGFYRVTQLLAQSGTLKFTVVVGGSTLEAVYSVSRITAGYQIVTSLPVTDLFQGRVVFLTTNSKLYRYTGSAWTPSVETVDLTGQINGAQIAPDSILTNHIKAGEVQANNIAANAITADKIDTGAVTAGKILVDTLSAIQASTGKLDVSDTLTLGGAGAIRAGKTGYVDNTPGYWLGFDAGSYKFFLGDATNHLKWDGTNLILTGQIIQAGNIPDNALTKIFVISYRWGAGTEFHTVFNTSTWTEMNSLLRIGVELGAAGTKTLTLTMQVIWQRDGGDDDDISLRFAEIQQFGGLIKYVGAETGKTSAIGAYILMTFEQTFEITDVGFHYYSIYGMKIGNDGAPYVRVCQVTAKVNRK